MKISVISPGKVREKWLRAGLDEYVKRLKRYSSVELVEVADSPDQLSPAVARVREGKAILSRLKDRSYVIALDQSGRKHSSEELALLLPKWFELGGSEISFVIGGATGLDPAILERADYSLSLSDMTFTHQMTRLILLEQCYRAFRIASNEPYHK
ncbi:MAG TPA: 23S rRNA (pseudouridine(1915)-N(3))-methyltransferase RlmH [Clostridiaceae bacterium]|nr:23S rRNA (pseudouridine(1915)-N(3))-methyltransferase RlmH [Clostridiaceae bacterium]